MKKFVFRRKALGGAIRIFVYEQWDNEFVEGGSKREFYHSKESFNYRIPVGGGRVYLHDSCCRT